MMYKQRVQWELLELLSGTTVCGGQGGGNKFRVLDSGDGEYREQKRLSLFVSYSDSMCSHKVNHYL